MGSEAAAEPGHDLVCPLCHSLFYRPLTTACNHTFCAFCWGRVFETRLAGDSREPGLRRRACPMCRQPNLMLADAQPNVELEGRAQESAPEMYAQRGDEIQQERARLASRRVVHTRLFVGNHHTVAPPRAGSSNVHDWTFFVRMESTEEEREFIDRVIIHLHPTFRPAAVVAQHPPYTVRRLGWGFFVVRAYITFRPEWGGETIAVPWLLDFEGHGSTQSVELELRHCPDPAPA